MDDRDLQIVKTYGKGVGDLKSGATNQVPEVRDVPRADRRQILVPHVHPRRRHAALQERDNVRIRMTVKYQDYKKYEGKSTIKYGDVVDEKTPTKK